MKLFYSLKNYRLKPSLMFVFLAALSLTSYSQSWLWAKDGGDIGYDAAYSVTVDEAGNTYVTGNIAGKAYFSGTLYQGNGIYDVFIAKYSPVGDLLWVKLAGGAGNDVGNAIKYSNGSLYVTGYFSGTASFETTTFTSRGSLDIFVAKYDVSGNLIWVKQAGGTGSDYGAAIDVDQSGNIYVGGTYEGAATLDTFQIATTNIYKESFFAKYADNGDVLWAKTTIGNGDNLVTGLAFDRQHSVYLTGFFGGNFKIGSTITNSSTPSKDIFLAKVDENGNTVWLRRAGSITDDCSNSVCVDNEGYPSITGYFSQTATFGNNTVTYLDYNDIFVARYDSSGNNLWVKHGAGMQLDIGFGITADENGNLFATGMFEDSIDFDGVKMYGDGRTIFLVSYSKNGNLRWVTNAGGTYTDCGLSAALAPSGKIVIAGYYWYTCFFDNIALNYSDNTGIFVAEYDPPFVNSVDELSGDLDVSVYPNPASSLSDCFIYSPVANEITLSVFDVLGKRIVSASFYSSYYLNPSQFPSGVYFIETSSGLKRKTIKWIKE